MARYRNNARDEQLEQELQELESQLNPQLKEGDPVSTASEEEAPPVTPDEEIWKKRHGDLRRYSHQIEKDLKKEIEELKSKINEKSTTNDMPRNKEEAEAWIKEYPDLARVITTLIANETELVREDVRSARRDLEEEKLQIAREVAWNKLLKAHPDFEQLKETDKFREWLASQPEVRGPRIGKSIYDALVNDTDADAAIQAINLYKNDLKLAGPRRREDVDAARPVTRTATSAPPENDGKRKFKESEIDKMDSRTFDRLEEEIEEARLDGRIIYDLSGAAR